MQQVFLCSGNIIYYNFFNKCYFSKKENNRTHSSMLILPQGRSATNCADVLRQIVLEDCRGMEPRQDHRTPTSDQSHHELYPLLSTRLPTQTQISTKIYFFSSFVLICPFFSIYPVSYASHKRWNHKIIWWLLLWYGNRWISRKTSSKKHDPSKEAMSTESHSLCWSLLRWKINVNFHSFKHFRTRSDQISQTSVTQSP